jgi:hypothetical protein
MNRHLTLFATSVVCLLPSSEAFVFDERPQPSHFDICYNQAPTYISQAAWVENFFQNSCKTDLDRSLRRYFGKGVNPYLNQAGVHEMWTVEKMNEEQRRDYYDLMSYVLTQIDDMEFVLTEEEAGRRLLEAGWDVETTIGAVRQKNEYYREFSLGDIKESEIQTEIGSKVFTPYGNDKEGRPVHYLVANRMKPAKIDTFKFTRYQVWSTEKFHSMAQSPYMVSDINVFDCGNVSMFENVSVNLLRTMLTVAPFLYPQHNHLTIMINTNWIFTSMFKLLKPIIPSDIREKLVVTSGKEHVKEL